jgi:hypothetical protein
MQERKTKPKPFENSLSALAQLALRESGAEGYAIFRRLPESRGLASQSAAGVRIEEAAITQPSPTIQVWGLEPDGILAFQFADETRSRRARAQLDPIVASIEAVWSAAETIGRYRELATQVAELETRLMDSRISDRVRGFLRNQGAPIPVDAIVRHVEGVLRPATTTRVLEQMTQDLEEEVEERRLTNRAKAILQSVHGMSEEEAHTHLRQVSRKTRRKLKDVALALIENHRQPATTGLRNGPVDIHSESY